MPDGCGPATKAVLRGQCRNSWQRYKFNEILRGMLDAGELEMFGERKGARYGLPRKRKARA